MHVLPKWTEKRCKISSSIFNVCWPRPSLMSTMWWRSTQLKGTRDQMLPFKKIQTTEELKRKGKIQWTQGKEKIEEGHEWNEGAGGPGIQKFLSTFTAHNIERKTKLLAISWRKCHNKSFHASLLVDLHALQRPQAKNWEKTKADRKKGERESEIRWGYRENCVAEVAVHVAHMLRRRRDLGRHSSRSPCVIPTMNRRRS